MQQGYQFGLETQYGSKSRPLEVPRVARRPLEVPPRGGRLGAGHPRGKDADGGSEGRARPLCMSDATSTADPAPTELPETSAGAVVDHREYDATVEAGYEGEDVPDPDSPIKFQFSWRKLWRVRACESN